MDQSFLLVGYHGEPKVNLFHNIRIIEGLYYPKRLKVSYSTTRVSRFVLIAGGEARAGQRVLVFVRSPDHGSCRALPEIRV